MFIRYNVNGALTSLKYLCFIGSGDPIEDVLNFKRNFEERFGLEHPTFYQGTYSQVNTMKLRHCSHDSGTF